MPRTPYQWVRNYRNRNGRLADGVVLEINKIEQFVLEDRSADLPAKTIIVVARVDWRLTGDYVCNLLVDGV